MNQYPKRLIEVDLPIKRISAHARRETSITSGHIKSLHIWWARRPLAACRAVNCASLWLDPADEECPESFRLAARDEMKKWGRHHRDLMSAESFTRFEAANKQHTKYENNEHLRSLLLDFIADFANWDNSASKPYIETSRRLTQAAHIANGGELGTRPLVVDPFAGGGAIPLEALKIGADATASDLNPIPILLNTIVLEYIPKYGPKLADRVRWWGGKVKEIAEKELAEFFPAISRDEKPIAYLWARTVKCEGPGCGFEIPLMRTRQLVNKKNKSVAVALRPNQQTRSLEFELTDKKLGESSATVIKGKAVCPICSFITPVASVRAQLKARRGGTKDARLVCVVTKSRSQKGKSYRLPTSKDFEALQTTSQALARESRGEGLSFVPNENIEDSEPRRIPLPIYGMTRWSDLFNDRQLLVPGTFCRIVRDLDLSSEADRNFASAIKTILALSASKLADRNSSLCRWIYQNESPGYTFGRQALPMLWDYAESSPLESGGGWSGIIEDTANMIETQAVSNIAGQVEQASASEQILPDDSVDLYFTDPPYYYSIPYSNLSDFFFVWLKRMVDGRHASLFGDEQSPKAGEIIQNLPHKEVAHKQKDRAYYEAGMTAAFAAGRRVTKPTGIGTIVFAHTETEAWEALLTALLSAGWLVSASWPIDTERSARMIAQRQSSLASSVHLVCRPRENRDGTLSEEIGDWREILRRLPNRVHEWMPRLAKEGVVGADAIFACLGPALEIFSRYSSVEKPSGEVVNLREYLEYVWAAVAKEALNMIFEGADASGFEEDARLTAMWLWTLFAGASAADSSEIEDEADESDDDESSGKSAKTKGYILEYDAARKIAQGLGAHLEDLTSIIEVKGDKARLLPVSERARDLFGYVDSSATEKKRKTKAQKKLFEEMEEFDYESTTGIGGAPEAGATTLDRIHQTMLLFGSGRSEAVRRFLVDDGVGNDERFWRLANALSALYPTGTDEKRWVDGVLARKKGLGF